MWFLAVDIDTMKPSFQHELLSTRSDISLAWLSRQQSPTLRARRLSSPAELCAELHHHPLWKHCDSANLRRAVTISTVSLCLLIFQELHQREPSHPEVLNVVRHLALSLSPLSDSYMMRPAVYCESIWLLSTLDLPISNEDSRILNSVSPLLWLSADLMLNLQLQCYIHFCSSTMKMKASDQRGIHLLYTTVRFTIFVGTLDTYKWILQRTISHWIHRIFLLHPACFDKAFEIKTKYSLRCTTPVPTILELTLMKSP